MILKQNSMTNNNITTTARVQCPILPTVLSYSEYFDTPLSLPLPIGPAIMYFIPKRSFFSKATQGYQSVQNPSERSSSDGILSSDTGLLEKEIEALRPRNSFWRSYSLVLTLNLVIFVLCLLGLGVVVSHSRPQALKGPSLIFCKIQSLSLGRKHGSN